MEKESAPGKEGRKKMKTYTYDPNRKINRSTGPAKGGQN